MRILLLSPVFPPARGGIETLARRLADHLPGDMLVVTLAPGPTVEEDRGADGRLSGHVLRVRNVPVGGRRSILRVNVRAVLAGLRYRPQVILVLHAKLAPAALLLGRLFGIPVVLYVHAKELREVPGLARLAVRGANATIAVSSYSAELAQEAGAEQKRIHVVHNGVDLPAENRAPRSPTPMIVTVSRLEDRYKGHDVFLEALLTIRRQIPDVKWIVVGEGTLRPELERRADELGLADCVTFLGAVDDAKRDEQLDLAWIFVMLSRRPPGRQAGEGFGISYVEAGAHGLPVVAGRVPGVTDAVHHEITGLLVDPTDAHEAAAATVRLLTDQELARDLGEGGLDRARQLHWPGVVDSVNDLLEHSARFYSRPSPRPHVGWRWARELLLGAPRPQ